MENTTTTVSGHKAIVAREAVFAFMYCGCIYEGGFQVVSLHRTRAGAESAMRKDKQQKLEEYIDLYGVDKLKSKDCDFGKYEEWAVEEMLIQD